MSLVFRLTWPVAQFNTKRFLKQQIGSLWHEIKVKSYRKTIWWEVFFKPSGYVLKANKKHLKNDTSKNHEKWRRQWTGESEQHSRPALGHGWNSTGCVRPSLLKKKVIYRSSLWNTIEKMPVCTVINSAFYTRNTRRIVTSAGQNSILYFCYCDLRIIHSFSPSPSHAYNYHTRTHTITVVHRGHTPPPITCKCNRRWLITAF